MPVIINMEMPKGCEIADHTLKDGVRDCPLSPICTARKKEIWKHGTLGDHIINYYPPNCPIVGEMPGEHGRLIDANVFKEKVGLLDDFECQELVQVGRILDEAPTVIPASDGE